MSEISVGISGSRDIMKFNFTPKKPLDARRRQKTLQTKLSDSSGFNRPESIFSDVSNT